VTAQLVAAQQRVAELTPLAEEADSLRLWVVEARRDVDKDKKAFEALSARSMASPAKMLSASSLGSSHF